MIMNIHEPFTKIMNQNREKISCYHVQVFYP